MKLLQSNPIRKNGKLIISRGKYLVDTAASALHSNQMIMAALAKKAGKPEIKWQFHPDQFLT
jgi:hypothetical protein